jgi:aerobic carbon-monoxide dehydrogenase medium subunit
VKPVDFDLHQPVTVGQTADLLASHCDDAKVLAGGQSLIPLLNFRLARPEHVIDIGRVGELCALKVTGPEVVIGAMVRQAGAERWPGLAARCPLLAAALPWIAHPPVRARGTIGGSLAHADPAAELPAVATALDATFVAARAGGSRVISAAGFYRGYLTTALEADELLTEIRFPSAAPRTGAAFLEVARRRGDFALVGCAVQVTLADGQAVGGEVIADARICLSGVAPVPLRCAEAERALCGLPPGALPRVLSDPAQRGGGPDRLLPSGITPPADLHASSDFRVHLAGVLIHRAVTQACGRALVTRPRPQR